MGIESLSETAHAETGKTEPVADPAHTSEHAEPTPDGFATSTATDQLGRLFDEPSSPPEKQDRLRGGIFSPGQALKLLNSHYLIGKSEQESGIFRIRDDGSLVFTTPEQFKLEVGNIFVQPSDGSNKPIRAEKFWKEHQWRHERIIVFKPKGTTDPSELNLWRGFGVEPRKGWQKQRRLLRHIWKIICRRDKAKFRYFIRWLAWAVQNPDKHSEVVVVLKSRKQGTGKSTVGVVMLKIFGPHGALVDDKERLLGRFNDWLETKSFILGEEIMWAGDPKSTDKLKSMITAPTLQVERKNGAIREIPNRLHPMMTTNHDHGLLVIAPSLRLPVQVNCSGAFDQTRYAVATVQFPGADRGGLMGKVCQPTFREQQQVSLNKFPCVTRL